MTVDPSLSGALAEADEAVSFHKREMKLHREALRSAAERRNELRAKLAEFGIGLTIQQAETNCHGRKPSPRHQD